MAGCALSGLLAISLIGCNDESGIVRNCTVDAGHMEMLPEELRPLAQLHVDLAVFLELLEEDREWTVDELAERSVPSEVIDIIMADTPDTAIRDVVAALDVDDEWSRRGVDAARMESFTVILWDSVLGGHSTGRAVGSAVSVLDNDLPAEQQALRNDISALKKWLRDVFPSTGRCDHTVR